MRTDRPIPNDSEDWYLQENLKKRLPMIIRSARDLIGGVRANKDCSSVLSAEFSLPVHIDKLKEEFEGLSRGDCKIILVSQLDIKKANHNSRMPKGHNCLNSIQQDDDDIAFNHRSSRRESGGRKSLMRHVGMGRFGKK